MKIRLKDMKKGFALIMAMVLLCGAFFVIPTETKAAESEITVDEQTDGVRYVQYDPSACTLGTAPTYSGVNDGYGYVFGGWYTKNTAKQYVPLRAGDATALDAAKNANLTFAKFVPSYVLSVKCQNFAGTKLETSTFTHMRVATSVDSRNYQEIGFDMKLMRKNPETGKYMVKTLGTYTSQHTYTGLKVGSNGTTTVYEPNEVFGQASEFILGWTLWDILQVDFASIIYVRPYWVTLDGAKVYGLTRYSHVEDGTNGYINVPINLKDAREILAGRMSISYDNTQLKFKDAERGRTFQDMAWDAPAGQNLVKCVGLVRNIDAPVTPGAVSGTATQEEIYINLRFEIIQDATEKDYAFDFAAADVEFGNVSADDEKLVSGYKVWTVKSGYLPGKK